MKRKLRLYSPALRLILLIVFITLFFCVSFLGFEGFILDYINRGEHQAIYLSNSEYAAALGIEQFCSDSFIQAYGEPNTIRRWFDPRDSERELVLYSYPAFDVLYYADMQNSGDERLAFIEVIMKDSSIQFGSLNIGVGSRRSRVHAAFLFDPKLSDEETKYESYDFPGVDEGFYGEAWWRILFDYDDSGKVKAMAYVISPN
ncbi:MAG: hypothetical protein LLF75_11905 [Eubacteriales bacterium]|nr:hypothetical protein [Eubacteriales bacterium]